jgi:hypothetical protein
MFDRQAGRESKCILHKPEQSDSESTSSHGSTISDDTMRWEAWEALSLELSNLYWL